MGVISRSVNVNVPLSSSSSQNGFGGRNGIGQSSCCLLSSSNPQCYYYYCSTLRRSSSSSSVIVWAKKKSENEKEDVDDEEPKKNKRKQNLFESVTEALDFAQVRSAEDAQLLEDAREATKSGDKMTRDQYGALRRKIGGTYKDFFKSYIDVDGEYVEEGWVDKTCKICKKDTRGEARQVDGFGKYVHVACLQDKPKSGGNFFTRLFS